LPEKRRELSRLVRKESTAPAMSAIPAIRKEILLDITRLLSG
jgi:hypothetical protein